MNALVAWEVNVTWYTYVIDWGYTKVAVGDGNGVHAFEAGSQIGFPRYHAVTVEYPASIVDITACGYPIAYWLV